MQLHFESELECAVKFLITVDVTKEARMPAPATMGLMITVICTTLLRG